jgi:hypothetical protein
MTGCPSGADRRREICGFRGQYMKSTTRLLALGLAGTAAVAVSSCGSSTPSEPGAAALTSSAQQSVRTASSVHVDGAGSNNGVPVAYNLGVNRAGDISGTIHENGANFDIISANGKVYIKATPEFLKQAHAPANVCTIVCGRWVELPPKEASQLTSNATMSTLTGEANFSNLPKLTEDGSTTVNGQSAWVLKAPDGGTVDVSQQSAHYPLQVKSASSNQGVLHYTQWNAVPKPTAPPASQVINLSGLK